MIGTQMTCLRYSHFKLDNVTTAAHLFAWASVALYASVYVCVSL